MVDGVGGVLLVAWYGAGMVEGGGGVVDDMVGGGQLGVQGSWEIGAMVEVGGGGDGGEAGGSILAGVGERPGRLGGVVYAGVLGDW